MMNTSKVTISLPEKLLRDIDREQRVRGESRSEFFRRAVGVYLRWERERELEDQYVQGYIKAPETPEDAEGIYKAGLASLAQEPWEEDGGHQ